MAMKITIEQVDIEQAIKEHIGSMMEIKPGAQLDIDLSATRGSAGFTATILIRNSEEVARESVVEAPVAPTNSKPTKTSKALNIPKSVAQPEESDEPETETVSEPEPETEIEEVQDDEVEKVQETEEVEESVETETEAAPRASLFSALNKPKN